jgi:hypothetical protein
LLGQLANLFIPKNWEEWGVRPQKILESSLGPYKKQDGPPYKRDGPPCTIEIGSDHHGHESKHPYKSMNSMDFGSNYKMFNCSLTWKTQLLGSGQLKDTIPRNTSQISAEPHLEGASRE